jgi:hypothetical protein
MEEDGPQMRRLKKMAADAQIEKIAADAQIEKIAADSQMKMEENGRRCAD